MWVFLSPFGALAIVSIAMRKLAPNAGSNAIGLALAAALLTSALFAFGVALHARRQPRHWFLERRTGREFFTRRRHSAYGLAVQYWGLLYLIGAVLILSTNSHKG